jgi:hypothetical protein
MSRETRSTCDFTMACSEPAHAASGCTSCNCARGAVIQTRCLLGTSVLDAGCQNQSACSNALRAALCPARPPLVVGRWRRIHTLRPESSGLQQSNRGRRRRVQTVCSCIAPVDGQLCECFTSVVCVGHKFMKYVSANHLEETSGDPKLHHAGGSDMAAGHDLVRPVLA